MDVLTPSLEDYLEAIWILGLKRRVVRVRDIIKFLNVKSSSVVGALKALSDRDLVVHERYGYVELTQKGVAVAKEIYERHKMLSKFLHEILGVDPKVAAEDACRMEHHISKETLERLTKFIEFIETCPEGEPLWLSSFHYFAKHGVRPEHCGVRAKTTNGDEAVAFSKLDELEVGRRGKIVRITARGDIKRRLLDMGLVPATEVRVEKVAPLGDPIDVTVKGYHLSLRKEEASAITVEVIE